MGLDYSYKLFFKREKLWDALEAAARLARPYPAQETIVVFPDGEIILPFGLSDFGKKISCLAASEITHQMSFAVSLYFAMDEEIQKYADEWLASSRQEEQFKNWELPLDAHGRLAIGNIYLTIYRGLNIGGRTDHDPNLVALDFCAATTRMSLLFENSRSIRETFTKLLTDNGGVYALLDREDDAVIVSWKGRECWNAIDSAWFPQRDIEGLIGKSSMRP